MTTKYRRATSELTLQAIVDHEPISTTKLAELLDTDMGRLSASIANWYRDARGEWAHVHRERDTSRRGLAYVYRYSSKLPARTATAKRKRDGLATTQTAVVHVAAPEQPAHVDKLAALVLWDVDDDVILLDADGGLIRGRRVHG
jgi:hypothetical protein